MVSPRGLVVDILLVQLIEEDGGQDSDPGGDSRVFSMDDLEGAVFPGVANNAKIGGALLPSLVLGIVRSTLTAAFIAALSLHGIILGPTIDVDHPGLLCFL